MAKKKSALKVETRGRKALPPKEKRVRLTFFAKESALERKFGRNKKYAKSQAQRAAKQFIEDCD